MKSFGTNYLNSIRSKIPSVLTFLSTLSVVTLGVAGCTMAKKSTEVSGSTGAPAVAKAAENQLGDIQNQILEKSLKINSVGSVFTKTDGQREVFAVDLRGEDNGVLDLVVLFPDENTATMGWELFRWTEASLVFSARSQDLAKTEVEVDYSKITLKYPSGITKNLKNFIDNPSGE